MNHRVEELHQAWLARVPRDYWDANLDQVEPTRVRPGVEDWLAALADTDSHQRLHGPNLLLFGPVGAGKTHAGFAAMRKLWFDGITSQVRWAKGRPLGRDFRYWSVPDVLGRLRTHELTVAQMVREQVMFLDDVGTTKATDWAQEQLFNIFNTRRSERQPVVATTNLGTEELVEHLGQPAYSRLVGDAHMVHVKGANRRREPKPLHLVEP